jgi:serine/threonine protein kinase
VDKPLQRPRQLAPGDKLGKYELIRQIATAEMAELYLARTEGFEGSEKLAVIKRILPQLATKTSIVDIFLDEARLAATIVHPNVAQVYDIGNDGEYFLAREYVHGDRLDRIEKIAREQGVPISMDAALTLIAGVCAGLHHAHEMAGADGKPLQIVHRDVSPSNVLVSYEGTVKLVDFGVARATGKDIAKRRLTGKVTYMSPEQCRADTVLDRRSDIYELGTLLYELTTGHTPFSGESEFAIRDHIMNVDVPAPTWIVPDYPPALEKIVMRALSRDPEARQQTALQLQTELEDFAYEQRLRVSPLVLTHLMSTLFPARLEEWAQVKSQGAPFVEQHVVKTLIDSASTSDDTLEIPPAIDPPKPVARPAAPLDAMPLAMPGERPSTPSSRKLRASLVMLVGLLLVGGGIGVYYGLAGQAESSAPPPISGDEPKPSVAAPPADPPPPIEAVAAPAQPSATVPAEPTVEPTAAKPTSTVPKTHKHPRPHKAAEPESKPNAAPPAPQPGKPESWEHDTPFVPMQSDR